MGKKRSFKEKISSYQVYLLVLLCLIFGLSFVKNLSKINEAKKRVERARQRVEKLKEDNKKLDEELAGMQKDEFLERQLRDKLGLVKEGEIVLVLPDPETLRKLVPDIPQEEETLPDPVWKKWLKLFM